MSGWYGRSPVTVQEWVAALPPLEDHGPDHPEDNMAHSEQTEQAGAEDKDSVEDKMDESSDNIKLGEEGGDFRFHIINIVIQIQIFVWCSTTVRYFQLLQRVISSLKESKILGNFFYRKIIRISGDIFPSKM